MPKLVHRLLLLVPLALLSSIGQPAAADNARSLKVEGVTEHFDVRYLPEWRYTGAAGPRGDAEMTLDVFVPDGEGPFPTVIYVHGGGYGGGTNRFGRDNAQLARRLLEEKFVVVSLNYILKEKGIFPQVWWDFRDAVRFLRINAETYKIDPLRIGAYGLSAGGWLVSSATVGNGDLLRVSNGGAVTARELADADWRLRVKTPDQTDNWLRPMRSPSPGWPGVHGGVCALSFDFDQHTRYAKPYGPVYQKWVGEGFTPKFWEDVVANGAEANIEVVSLTDERYRGKAVHVPPFYPRNERETARARGANGRTGPLGELVIDFFRRHLVDDMRLPVPEIFPVPRVLEESTEVSMVPPPAATIHYTIDGSTPTTASPVYVKPFTITGDTVVKAMSTREGMRASGVNAAHFVEGPAAPRIVGPESLPPGRTGEPYEVRFESNVDEARWMLQGELVPHVPFRGKHVAYPNNMRLDGKTGTWSGKPWKPGTYWVQVWVSRGDGTLSSYRNYRWTVTGDELPGAAWAAEASERDQFVEVAPLEVGMGWHGGLRKELAKRLERRGVRSLIVGEPDEDGMLLVWKEDRDTALASLKTLLERHPKLVEKTDFLDE